MSTEVLVSVHQTGDIDDLGYLRTAYIADGYIVRLFQAGFVPTDLSLEADFVAAEATFTGYAAQPEGGAGHLFSPVGLNSQGQAEFATEAIFYQATDAVHPNNIGGFWVESTALHVRAYCIFPQSVAMLIALAFFTLQIFVGEDGQYRCEITN